MKKLIRLMKSSRGEIAIPTSLMVIIFVTLLALSLTFFGASLRQITQNTMAYEVVRYAEMKGRTGESVATEMARIESAAGFDVDFRWSADYLSSSDKVQIGDEMTLTITSETFIGIGGLVTFPVQIKSRATGRSEVYWK